MMNVTKSIQTISTAHCSSQGEGSSQGEDGAVAQQGRKKTKLKDPTKPKKTLTVYNCFLKAMSGFTFKEKTDMWSIYKEGGAVSTKEGDVIDTHSLELMVARDKQRYENELAEWLPLTEQQIVEYNLKKVNSRPSSKIVKTGSLGVKSARNIYQIFLTKIKSYSLGKRVKHYLWEWLRTYGEVEVAVGVVITIGDLYAEADVDKHRFKFEYKIQKEIEMSTQLSEINGVDQPGSGLFNVINDGILSNIVRNETLNGLGLKMALTSKRFSIALCLSSKTPKRYICSGKQAQKEYGIALLLVDLAQEFSIENKQTALEMTKHIKSVRKDSHYPIVLPSWRLSDMNNVMYIKADVKIAHNRYRNPWQDMYIGHYLFFKVSKYYNIDLEQCKAIIHMYESCTRKLNKRIFPFMKYVNYFSNRDILNAQWDGSYRDRYVY
jgi:hypothetical protein